MSAMEHSTTDRPPGTTPGDRSAAATDTAERTGARHFQSLILPGLAKGPILPAWLRRPFRRPDTHASR
jgi:hypothetical protein